MTPPVDVLEIARVRVLEARRWADRCDNMQVSAGYAQLSWRAWENRAAAEHDYRQAQLVATHLGETLAEARQDAALRQGDRP